MSDNWYYQDNGAEFGPFERNKIERLIALGRLRAETRVRSETMSDWDEAGRHF